MNEQNSALETRSQADRAEELLRRYPEISAEETSELVAFLKRGPIIEVGRITSASELRNKVAALRKEHRSEFELGLRDYLKFTVIVAVTLGAILWFLSYYAPA